MVQFFYLNIHLIFFQRPLTTLKKRVTDPAGGIQPPGKTDLKNEKNQARHYNILNFI